METQALVDSEAAFKSMRMDWEFKVESRFLWNSKGAEHGLGAKRKDWHLTISGPETGRSK